MAIAIANREFFHLISFLNKRTVHYVGAFRSKLRVQSLNVAHPEEGIPRSSLLFVWHDKIGFQDSAQHDRETIATADGKLDRCSCRILTVKSQYLLIERRPSFHIRNAEIWCAAEQFACELRTHPQLLKHLS